MPRPLGELARLLGGDPLSVLSGLDPYQLGATSSPVGCAGEHRIGDRYVRRTARRVDARLKKELAGEKLVVVIGPSKAGKTRTLFEAVRAYAPIARVVRPIPGRLTALSDDPRISGSDDTLVVWLDDLHEYLIGSDPLTLDVLARLKARPGRTLVVATLRLEMRAQLRGEGELGKNIRLLLEQARTIDLCSTRDDPDEQAAAIAAYPGWVFGEYGLGEVLAGAPELLARYDDARAADPLLHQVIAIVIDWARIGRRTPIPEPLLIDLTVRGLRATRPDLDVTPERVRAAIVTARTPPQGAGLAAALRASYLDDTRVYKAFEYLVAADDGQDHHPRRPIPSTFWHDATRDATSDAMVGVGVTAYFRGEISVAYTLFEQAAEAGDIEAMYSLGILLRERGELGKAENWHRRAAEAGHPGAMTNFGYSLAERGELSEAEIWYRRGAEAGDPGAMYNLGIVLAERGELGEAEIWWRKAAAAGDPGAMYNLGALFAECGEYSGAVFWFRQAAAAGLPAAMDTLRSLFAERNERGAPGTWYREVTAAEFFDIFHHTALLFRHPGERTESR